MEKNLSQKYDHKKVEEGRYNEWLEKGYFTAGDKSKDPYTIVIPPPNVTGILHIGHAWDNTLQDIISRFKRMQGYDMLYLPGMDHAGIATQAKVDARLKSEGISRYDLGREGFLERAWQWKEEYAGVIRQHQAVHLSAKTDAGDFGCVKPCDQLPDTFHRFFKPVFRILFRPARMRKAHRIFLGYHIFDITCFVHHKQFHGGRSKIDSNVIHL